MLKSLLPALSTIAALSAPVAQAASSPEESSAEIAQALVTKTLPGGPGTIAVGSITHSDGTCSELTRFLEEEIVDALFNANTGDYQVIERSQLDAIFKELELVFDGTIAPETAIEIGQVKGVRGVVSGRITAYSDRILFRVRLIDTVSGAIFSSSRSEFPITAPVRDLMSRKSAAICGFQTAASSAPAFASSVGSVAPSASYDGNGFVATVRSARYDPSDEEIFFNLRVTNQSNSAQGFSYIPNSYNVSDDLGNSFKFKDVWQGIRNCNSNSYKNCTQANSSVVVTIPAGKTHNMAMNFSTAGMSEVGLVNLGVDFVFVPDVQRPERWEKTTISFFDLSVKK